LFVGGSILFAAIENESEADIKSGKEGSTLFSVATWLKIMLNYSISIVEGLSLIN
jgi:hypothetical protein